MNAAGLIALSFVLLLFLLLLVLIGTYVYRDASKRKMNAPLWTILAVFAPAMIGFILYLLVRGSYSDAQCPVCSANVSESFAACPHCGAKLKPLCPSCQQPVEPEWKVCPYCARPIEGEVGEYSPPIRKKDRFLGKLLAAVILIPALLLLLAILSFSFFGTSSSGALSATMLSAGDYLSSMDNREVDKWMEKSGSEYSTAYVLRYSEFSDEYGNTDCYAIYLPAAGEGSSLSCTPSGGFFRDTAEVRFTTGIQGGDAVHCVSLSSSRGADLQIYCNGQKTPVEFTDVSFYPFPSDIGYLKPST